MGGGDGDGKGDFSLLRRLGTDNDTTFFLIEFSDLLISGSVGAVGTVVGDAEKCAVGDIDAEDAEAERASTGKLSSSSSSLPLRRSLRSLRSLL